MAIGRMQIKPWWGAAPVYLTRLTSDHTKSMKMHRIQTLTTGEGRGAQLRSSAGRQRLLYLSLEHQLPGKGEEHRISPKEHLPRCCLVLDKDVNETKSTDDHSFSNCLNSSKQGLER